jgi:hypothetical protein
LFPQVKEEPEEYRQELPEYDSEDEESTDADIKADIKAETDSLGDDVVPPNTTAALEDFRMLRFASLINSRLANWYRTDILQLGRIGPINQDLQGRRCPDDGKRENGLDRAWKTT